MGFAVDIAKFGAKSKKQVNLVRRKIALDLMVRVIYKTPVKTGRARGGWQGSTGSPITTDNEFGGSPSDAGPKAESSAIKAIDSVRGDESIFLTNNVEYIVPLEDGSSDQAPSGMVKTTLREYPGIVEDAVNEVAT